MIRRTSRKEGAAARLIRFLYEVPFTAAVVADASSKRLLQVNQRFCEMLGATRAELLRRTWIELCHPEDRGNCDAALGRLQRGEASHASIEQRLLRGDGSPMHAEIDVSLGRGAAAGLVIALVQDVSERKRGEARLAESESRYRSLFHGSASAMKLVDPDSGAIVDANSAWCALYGWSRDEILKRRLTIFDVSLTLPKELRARLRSFVEGTVSRVEAIHRTASGALLDVEIDGGPVEIDGRKFLYAIVRDISEQRRAEAARHDAEQKLRAIVEQSIAGIYMIEEGRFSYVNPRLAEIFGYSGPRDIVGRPVADLVWEEDRPLVLENVRKRLAGETSSVKYEFRGRRKDGTAIDVGVHGSAATVQGRPIIIGILQDITEKRRAERMIQEYVQRIEQAVTGSIAAISHMVELRDPYTAGHQRRVGEMAAAFGAELGLDAHRVQGLHIAGYVHDIGKITVPAEILAKPGRLTAAELEIVRKHAADGFEILKSIESPWPIAEVARQHHERLDGSGYPRGMKGEEILLEARITAIADVIEAMASHRPYRPAIGIEAALEEIERGAGRLYDDDAAAAALRLFREKDYRVPA